MIELKYKDMVYDIIKHGHIAYPTKGTVLALTNQRLVIEPEHPPLLTSRRIYWKGLVGELKAFIANETTSKGFEKHGCNFWGAWSNEDGTLDVDYARLLHNFNEVNQLERLLKGLEDNSDSRKHVISLWDPSSKARQVPCVLSYQFHVIKGTLEMTWTQRSADVMIGLASDMFSAWLFNQLVARTVGLIPGKVYMNIGDAHIYREHIPMARKYITNITRNPPAYAITGNIYDFDIIINGYKPVETMKFELMV